MEALSTPRALEEAGYRIGTAYQLADDLLDIMGSEDVAGKTLGADSKRRKFTLPQVSRAGQQIARERIFELCGSALECAYRWPWICGALTQFFACDLQPVFSRYDKYLSAGVGLGI